MSTTKDYLIRGMPTALLSTQKTQLQPENHNATMSTSKKIEHTIDINFTPEYKETELASSQATAQAAFNMPKLRRLLK